MSHQYFWERKAILALHKIFVKSCYAISFETALRLLLTNILLRAFLSSMRFPKKLILLHFTLEKAIPNKEIKYFFERTIINWFNRPQYPNFLMSLLEDFIKGNIMNIQNKLTAVILDTMSFHDVAENRQEALYHGFMLGMSLGLKGRYEVESNRESGYGRYDIAWFPKDPLKDPGVIFEIKIAQNETAQTALEQMDDKEYATALKKHGCKTIKMYGLHFDGKIVTTKMFS